MEELLDVLTKNMKACENLNEQFQSQLGLKTDDIPISGLNMAHQKSVLMLEVVSYYYDIWGKKPRNITASERTQQIQENTQRLMSVGRASFIEILSAFEFCLKEAVKTYPGIVTLPKNKPKIYLMDVIKSSEEAGIIPTSDFAFWNGIRHLRNSLVHNNGIADTNETFSFAYNSSPENNDPPPITMVRGQMSEGNIIYFPKLCAWAIAAYGRWCEGYMASR